MSYEDLEEARKKCAKKDVAKAKRKENTVRNARVLHQRQMR